MPSRLQRFHHSGQTHFITFSCWHRRPNFADAATPPGPAWDDYYSDIAIYSTDGTVTPIYYRQNSIGLSYFSGGSISNPQASVQVSNSAGDAELPANTTTYYLSDQIGSARMLVAAGGWPVSTDIYYPFGQEQSAPADNNHYKFTGKERDAETGFDYFGARYYASGMGRWLSPDWSSSPEGVPYAQLDDPQSLNLYAYVQGNPESASDLDGHELVTFHASNIVQAQQIASSMGLMAGTVTQVTDDGGSGPSGGAAQQQYGRQPDGSYKANPAEVLAAIKAGKPILEPGNPDHKSECVFACKALSQMKNIGTSQWRKGKAAVDLNNTTDIGLAIATLGSGRYPSQNGNSGIYMGHDANGGIIIVDQWPDNGPKYNHPFAHTLTRHDKGPAMDPNAYYVIIVPNR